MSEPTSVTTRPISEEDMRILAEETAIREGVADVTLSWGALENAMVILLREILGIDDWPMSSVIYFTPAALEVRITLVSNCFRHFFSRNGTMSEAISPKWEALMNVVGRLRKTRNNAWPNCAVQYRKGTIVCPLDWSGPAKRSRTRADSLGWPKTWDGFKRTCGVSARSPQSGNSRLSV